MLGVLVAALAAAAAVGALTYGTHPRAPAAEQRPAPADYGPFLARGSDELRRRRVVGAIDESGGGEND